MAITLTAKLHLPEPIADHVERSALHARLDEGLSRALTVVSALAGYGKTSLIAGWLRGRADAPDHAWYTIDEMDDLGRFVNYLVHAIRTVHPDFHPDWIEPAKRMAVVSIEDEAMSLASVCQALPTRVVLVLDDYHFISDARIHRLMGLLIRHCPETLHAVILTRSELPPEVGLSRLRGRGRLAEFGLGDLTFAREEARAFIKNAAPGAISDTLADSVWRQTEG